MKVGEAGKIGNIKLWNRGEKARRAIYIICALLTFSATVILLLRASGCLCDPFPVPEFIDRLIQLDALGGIISTVGTITVIIAWLINVTEHTVCGERIGNLVRWAYPHFFSVFLLLFLATFFMGIYISKGSGQRCPTLLITISLGICASFIGRVCYVFVLNFQTRERIAYTYYLHRLRYAEQDKQSGGSDIFRAQCDRIMLRLTNYVAELETSGEEIPCSTIFELWVVLVESCNEIKEGSSGATGLDVLNDECCSLAERFWDVLLRIRDQVPPQLEVLRYLNENEQQDKEANITQDHLAAGLLLALARSHKEDDCFWEQACNLLFELQYHQRNLKIRPTPVMLQKLLWGLAWIIIVTLAYQDRRDEEQNAYVMIGEQFRRAKIKIEEQPPEEIEQFLRRFSGRFLEEFGYRDGIYGENGHERYEMRMMEYLNEDRTDESYKLDYTNAVVAVQTKFKMKNGR